MYLTSIIQERIYIPKIPQLKDYYQEISNNFTYTNPVFIKRKAMNFWTGNIDPKIKNWNYVMHPILGPCISIPRGGIHKLKEINDQFDVKISYKDKRFSNKPITNLYNDIELWPEQKILSKLMFKHQNCLIRSPTGSGKTELTLKVIEWILKDAGPVLVIVWEGTHKSGLMGQWVERICKRFGLVQSDVGMIRSGMRKIKPITVGMQQTLKNVGRQYVNHFGGIVCDEIQRFAAPTFRNVIDIYPAKYRIGISADETRKDGQEFLIYDCFGNVVGEIERQHLVNKRKIMDVTVRLVPSKFDYEITVADETYKWIDLPSNEKDFNDLLNEMILDEERNNCIWPFMLSCLKTNHTVMVATSRVEHARYWDKRIRDSGFTSGLMLGGIENNAEYASTTNSLKNKKINAGVGTIQKIARGLDIPTWDRGFLLTPLASNKQLLEQLIGRLRRTSEGKKDAVLYYIFDDNIYPYHLRTLRKLYPGKVQILNKNNKFERL